MIYGHRQIFRFTTAKRLLNAQDGIYNALSPEQYGRGCWIIARNVEHKFGIPIVLVGLRKYDGSLTPHFINQTAAGNLVDLKQRVSMANGKVISRKKCVSIGDHVLPENRTTGDYVFDCTKSDFPENHRETFMQFRQMLKKRRV